MTTTVLAYIPSPSQGVWHLGPVPIRAYALFIVAGMLVALFIGDKRWQERGGEPGVVYSIFWWAMPFGLIGGRLYHVITDWRTYFGDDGAGLLAAFKIWEGGLGIWGAVALGGVGAWIGCRQHGIPLPAFGDAVAPGIVLAQAIGRLGNYFNQELYGRPTTLPWGLEVYERRNASGVPDSLNGVSTGQPLIQGVEAVHPTFLYELLWNLLVFAALIYIDRRFKIGHGRLFAMYVAGYCLGRFWIELMRSDLATEIAGIRVNSFTSTFVFIGAVVYIMVAPKGREDPATLKGKPSEVAEAKVPAEEDTSIEEFVKELTGVAAATTGVVAAAKVAGESEDEDAEGAVDDETEVEPDKLSEAATEAEALAEGAPSDDIAEAEEFAEAKEAAEEAEPVGGVGAVEGEEAVEAEEAAPEAHEAAVDAAEEAEDVAAEVATSADEEPEADAEPVDEIEVGAEPTEAADEPEPEAEEAAEAETEETEPVGGVGAVEGGEAIEVEEAAPEAHEAAVDAAEEAEDVAAEAEEAEEPESEEPGSTDETEAVEAEGPEEIAEGGEKEPEAESEAAAEAEALVEDVAEAPSEDIAEAEEFAAAGEEPEPVGGVGAVEGEEAVAVEEAAPEAHEAAVDAAEEAEDVAAEAEEAEEPESEEPEPADETEAVEAEEPKTEDAEAAVEKAEGEPTDDDEVAEEVATAEESAGQAQEAGGRIRRWLRSRRG